MHGFRARVKSCGNRKFAALPIRLIRVSTGRDECAFRPADDGFSLGSSISGSSRIGGTTMHRRETTEAREAREKEYGEDARRLREFAAFAKFSDDDLRRIARATHRTSTSGPWPLIQEQTPSNACYILLSGEAGVYVGGNRIALVGPGEVIGESALRRGKLRNATVTTTGKAEALHIARDDLDRLLTEVPALRQTMDTTVARHVPQAATADPS